ncbi:MAG: hypothetical protein MI861_12875, partial [Pirellulales bacterium]|nr:hypothetical protein [Pirellulales bacterium]
EISLAQFGPVIVVMSLANDAAHFLLLAAAGSFVCFQFRDLTIPDNEAHDVTTRPVWSIRGMFGATLVSAVILATLMWLRQLYSRTEAADFYPETDVGYIAWIVSNLLCSVTVLLAAAARCAGASVLLVGWWIITAVAIAVSGTLIWQLFLPSELSDSPSPYLVETLSGVAWMYLLHGQAFRFWNWNGYSLVRVRRDKNRLA